MKSTKMLVCLLTALTLMGTGLPAQAGMVGTSELASSVLADGWIGRGEHRDWIVEQLRRGGVEESMAIERVAAMTDVEVARIYQRLDEMPAGGISSEVILIGVIAFLILEVMGVTDVIPEQ